MKIPLLLLASALTACGGGSANAREASPADSSGTAVSQAASAPVSDSVLIVPAATFDGYAAQLARKGSPGDFFNSGHGYRVVESRRVTTGSVEVHDDWMDITVIQVGRATLHYGGTSSGGSVTAPGEHRGGTIAGGTTRAVGPGDLVIVPARTPHQFELANGDSVRYLTVKVPAAAAAAR